MKGDGFFHIFAKRIEKNNIFENFLKRKLKKENQKMATVIVNAT